tara:strand:- start:1305 stop:2123 length:819 start_codon:yes stop_codon:yes gene_type:complete
MKGLIFGTGKLSNHLTRSTCWTAVSRQTCDISNIDSVREQVKIYQPEVIINCAAKTNLEYCDENKTDAYNTNTLGVINLLHLCEENNIKLVHISSGCLFDGNETISTEESTPTPAAWYTHTKVWADEYLQNYGYEDYLILRPRQMISAIEHPTNMLTKFANYGTIYAHKELNSLTCVEDFIDMLEHLVSINAKGIFNCSNDGVVTPYQIALGVQAYIEPSLEVNESDYEHTLTLQPNKRVNTILCNEKLKSTGYKPRTATDALEWCLKNYNG